eukprot:Awhi_evm1s11929
MTISVEAFKAICLVGTFLFGLSGLLIFPIKRHLTHDHFNTFVDYSNAFGSGVIVSVGLLHMLVDANEKLEEFFDYPMAFAMAIVGYVMIYFVEEVALRYFLKKYQGSNVIDHAHVHGQNAHSNHNQTFVDSSNVTSEDLLPTKKEATSTPKNLQAVDGDGKIAIANDKEKNLDKKNARSGLKETVLAVFLLVAISFHSFFAGLAIGVETEIADIVPTFIAIIAHKGVAAFVIGQAFILSSLSTIVVVLLLIAFASTTPLGIGVGWIIQSLSGSTDLASGLIIGMSAGTFLYLGSVIGRDKHVSHGHCKSKAGSLRKFGLWLFGAAIMAVAAIWA